MFDVWSNFICLGSLTILSNSKPTGNGLWFACPQNIFLLVTTTPFLFSLQSQLHQTLCKKTQQGSKKNKFTKIVVNLFEKRPGALSQLLDALTMLGDFFFIFKSLDKKRPTATDQRC